MDGAPDLSSEFDNRQLRTNRRQTTAALAHIGSARGRSREALCRAVCRDAGGRVPVRDLHADDACSPEANFATRLGGAERQVHLVCRRVHLVCKEDDAGASSIMTQMIPDANVYTVYKQFCADGKVSCGSAAFQRLTGFCKMRMPNLPTGSRAVVKHPNQ